MSKSTVKVLGTPRTTSQPPLIIGLPHPDFTGSPRKLFSGSSTSSATTWINYSVGPNVIDHELIDFNQLWGISKSGVRSLMTWVRSSTPRWRLSRLRYGRKQMPTSPVILPKSLRRCFRAAQASSSGRPPPSFSSSNQSLPTPDIDRNCRKCWCLKSPSQPCGGLGRPSTRSRRPYVVAENSASPSGMCSLSSFTSSSSRRRRQQAESPKGSWFG